jgi:DNA helicase HerA-like ATPase
VDKPFEDEIVDLLRDGKIVIMDLSQGDPDIQATYSERVCKKIFAESMGRFVRNELTNFIQMYFEEAHNLFPRREERDLTQIYNRLAKEGQKLRIGLCYATQEVSSISGSILKNTQNWFVSHLNNQDELRELNKYYDFEDFTDSLRRTTDRGFIRLKTDSNTFIVPIQVDQFKAQVA